MRHSKPNIDSENYLFSICLISILFFYQTGDTQTFRVALKKALDYFNINKIDSILKPFSNLIFDRLSVFGIIEKSVYQNRTIWKICTPSIVHIGNNEHIVIGDKTFIRNCIALVNKGLQEHQIYRIPFNFSDIAYSLVFPKVTCGKDEIISNLKNLSYSYRNNDTKTIFELIPNLQDVSSSVLTKCGRMILDRSSLFYFDFKKLDWVEENREAISYPGYYKVVDAWNMPLFIVYTKDNIVYQVLEKDWGFFLACYYLNCPIKVQFDNQLEILKIHPSSFKMFPLLIKKILVLQEFKWPEIKEGSYLIKSIRKVDLNFILNNMGIFKVNYI